MNVGFVGLGRMGTPMARSFLRAGFPLTVLDRTSRRALLLGDQGAAVAESPAEVSEHCDEVIIMLAEGDAATAVPSGPDGVLGRARELLSRWRS